MFLECVWEAYFSGYIIIHVRFKTASIILEYSGFAIGEELTPVNSGGYCICPCDMGKTYVGMSSRHLVTSAGEDLKFNNSRKNGIGNTCRSVNHLLQ